MPKSGTTQRAMGTLNLARSRRLARPERRGRCSSSSTQTAGSLSGGLDGAAEHVLVENASGRLPRLFAERPCALLVVGRDPDGPLAWRGWTFVERWRWTPVRVYVPSP